MKRQFHSSSPPSSPLSNSQISDELEPIRKRPRIFVSSPTPPPDYDENNDDCIIDSHDEDEDDEEIIIDDFTIPSVTVTGESESEPDIEDIDDDDDDDDTDIIEIEQQQQQNLNLFAQENNNGIIIVSDSDSDSDDNSDDQGIDVNDDDILPSISSLINTSPSSSDIEDVEIVHDEIEEELTLMEDDADDDLESLEIVNIDDDNTNTPYNTELIDLTDDEPNPISCSSTLLERKLSIDVQQCPICLETLSHLQRTGVYLIITRCRHVMCILCSRQLLATSSRCPLCRENVNSTTLMPYCILT